MNAGIFLVATQGNIHALYISPKGLIMGMLLAITTCIVAAIFLGTAFPAIDILGFALVLSTLFILNINSK